MEGSFSFLASKVPFFFLIPSFPVAVSSPPDGEEASGFLSNMLPSFMSRLEVSARQMKDDPFFLPLFFFLPQSLLDVL